MSRDETWEVNVGVHPDYPWTRLPPQVHWDWYLGMVYGVMQGRETTGGDGMVDTSQEKDEQDTRDWTIGASFEVPMFPD
jgi:hypothetical protein